MSVRLGPLTLAGRRLRISENRLLRYIFGLKMDEVTGEWGETVKEKLHDLYSGLRWTT